MDLRTILTVALYEARTLWRTWFFRIFAGIIVLLLIGMNGIMLGVGQFTTWVFRAIPANIPYANMLLLNLIQSIVVIIPATDFMKRDRSMDTTDVVYIRSMTNTSYVLGKAFGNILVFACLNAAVLLCAALFNFFAGDVPPRLSAYVYYAALISLPTLVFCIGLSFLLMSVIRSQPLSLVAMFGIFGLAFFFLPNLLFSLFDFAALRTPLMFSDITGFGPMGGIVAIRSIYLLVGIAFILIAALRLKRLPQSTIVSKVTLLAAIALCLGAGGIGAAYVHVNTHDQRTRTRMIDQHNRQFGLPCVSVVHDDLRIVHSGASIKADARVTVSNQTDRPIDEYQFRLNPGLVIRKIHGSQQMNSRRSLDYVVVTPAHPLPVNGLDTISFEYEGSIDESACYLDVPASDVAQSNAVFFFQRQAKYAFIGKRFVLLTPESGFFPQAGAGYCSNHPEVNFAALTGFTISVSADPSLTVISQGPSQREPGGVTVFYPPVPMPGITVLIGPYANQSIVVDSVRYSLLTLAHHDRFKSFFKDLSIDSIASLIRGSKADFESLFKMTYPYDRFTVAEVPLQFTEFQRVWTTGHESLQPEIALLPENGFLLGDADFKTMIAAGSNRRGRDQEVLTPREQQSMMLQRFLNSTFGRDNSARRVTFRPFDRSGIEAQTMQWLPPLSAASADLFVFPEYFTYALTIHSPSCPVFSLALESYFKKRASGDGAGIARIFTGGATNDERVNLSLQNNGFDQIIKDPSNRSIVPDIAQALGDYLLTVLQKNIGDQAFDSFMREVAGQNRFGTIDIMDFCASIKRRFHFDFQPYLMSCYEKHPLPGYVLDNIEANQVRDKSADRFQVRFEIANPESAQGIIKVSLRTGTQGPRRAGEGGGFAGGGRGGFSGGGVTVDRIISLEPRQSKEIDIMTDQPPRMLSVNTLISKNIPATIVHPFSKVESDAGRAPFDGERVIAGITAMQPGVVIVDDEDSGFSIKNKSCPSILDWFKGFSTQTQEQYAALRAFNPPTEWTKAVGPQYFGRYVHSVHYIKAGGGKKRIAWQASIKMAGTYEIYAFYGAMGFTRRTTGRANREPLKGSYHYIVHHDDGIENPTLDLKDIQNGWNSLGRYHLSPGSAEVELTDEGSQGIIFGDAIKWEKE